MTVKELQEEAKGRKVNGLIIGLLLWNFDILEEFYKIL